jgi:hypothetical protein
MTGFNNTISNVATPNGNGYVGGFLLVDNQAFAGLSLTSTAFSNITNSGDGGAIHTNSAKNFVLTTCVFDSCKSTNGRGGAIFINGTGIFTYIRCRFYGNNALIGGCDIHHNQNILSCYSTSNFVQTCSDSTGFRTMFPNNENIDNFLLGFFFFFFFFFH